jgi:hypothetical protein
VSWRPTLHDIIDSISCWQENWFASGLLNRKSIHLIFFFFVAVFHFNLESRSNKFENKFKVRHFYHCTCQIVSQTEESHFFKVTCNFAKANWDVLRKKATDNDAALLALFLCEVLQQLETVRIVLPPNELRQIHNHNCWHWHFWKWHYTNVSEQALEKSMQWQKILIKFKFSSKYDSSEQLTVNSRLYVD